MFNANKYTCKCWLLNIYEQVKGLHPELTAFANASKLEKSAGNTLWGMVVVRSFKRAYIYTTAMYKYMFTNLVESFHFSACIYKLKETELIFWGIICPMLLQRQSASCPHLGYIFTVQWRIVVVHVLRVLIFWLQ